jgi:anti-anti-sigma factor
VTRAFCVSIDFSATPVVVSIQGELDIATAPELTALLGALIDRGHRAVALDLVALDFMDASGLGVIVAALNRLGHSTGALTVRSPPSMICRLLSLTGLSHVLSEDDRARSVA